MTMWAIKNREGKYWQALNREWTDDVSDAWETKNGAESVARDFDAQVVPMVEKPKKEEVSEREAALLVKAKLSANPASFIERGARMLDPNGENRLIWAYVNGWKIIKPKRYLVKVEGLFDRPTYYALTAYGFVGFGYLEADKRRASDYSAHHFTQVEIDEHHLQGCQKIEVPDEDDE